MIFTFFIIFTFFFLQSDDMQIELSKDLQPKPDPGELVFGKQFTDHMLTIEWDSVTGWGKPQIKPFGNLSLHPASSALHYATEVMTFTSNNASCLFACLLILN